MKDIRTLNLEQLTDYFREIGEKPFRAKQVYDWLWSKNLHSIDEMTNLSKDLREKISQEYIINPISVDQLQKSTDGTIKNGVKLHDGLLVESVLIPTDEKSGSCRNRRPGGVNRQTKQTLFRQTAFKHRFHGNGRADDELQKCSRCG